MVKSVVSKVQAFVDKLNSMDEGTRKTIIQIGLFVVALGPTLVILGKIITVTGTTMKAFAPLGIKIAALGTKVGSASGLFYGYADCR